MKIKLQDASMKVIVNNEEQFGIIGIQLKNIFFHALYEVQEDECRMMCMDTGEYFPEPY